MLSSKVDVCTEYFHRETQNSQVSKCFVRNLKMTVGGIKQDQTLGVGKVFPKWYLL